LKQLAQILRAKPEVTVCLATQLYRHASGHLETSGEAEIVEAIGRKAAAAGAPFGQLLTELVLSDGYRFAGAVK
jgi:hypothetical protein